MEQGTPTDQYANRFCCEIINPNPQIGFRTGITNRKGFFDFWARSNNTRNRSGSGTPLVYMPAYVTSTDNGATWSTVIWVDFRQALGASRFDRLWDYTPDDQSLQLQGDMAVGFDGRVHFALGLQDTNMAVGQNRNVIAEIL